MWKKTKNGNIEGVALEDKVRQKKSMCVVCDSGKSTFLKPIRPIKKQNSFYKLQKHENLLFKI